MSRMVLKKFKEKMKDIENCLLVIFLSQLQKMSFVKNSANVVLLQMSKFLWTIWVSLKDLLSLSYLLLKKPKLLLNSSMSKTLVEEPWELTCPEEDHPLVVAVLVVSRNQVLVVTKVEEIPTLPLCLLEILVSRPINMDLSNFSQAVDPLKLWGLQWVMMVDPKDLPMLNLWTQKVPNKQLSLMVAPLITEN